MGGRLASLLDLWVAEQFILIVSDEIVRKYVEVLHRPKLGLEPGQIDAVVALVLQAAEFITPTGQTFDLPADPDDAKFLQAAVAGSAQYLVSGDHHLLDLNNFQGVRMATARAFIDLVESQLPPELSVSE
jgi:putative PIN family toxin of toxin-antitoxin system